MNDPAITTSHVKSNVFAGVKSSINSNLFMVFGMNESLKRPSTKQQQQHYHSGVPIMCWSTILWMLAANTKFSRQKLNPKWRERLRLWISMIQLKMNSFFFAIANEIGITMASFFNGEKIDQMAGLAKIG